MVFLSLIVLGGVWAGVTGRRFRIMAVAVCLFHLTLWTNCLLDFQKDNRGLTRDFFPQETHDKILTGLIFDPYFRRFPTYIHFPSYYIVWNKGIAATAFLRWGYSLFHNDLPKKKLPVYDEWIGKDARFEQDKLSADYLLVRGKIPETYQDAVLADFKKLREENKWVLYERRKPFRPRP